jgi:hypothetical protein
MRRRPWFAVGIFLFALALVGIVMALVFNAASAAKDDLWWSISRAGVGIAFTAVAAAATTWAFKIVDQRRVRDEERRRLYHQVVEAYNEVKAVRRRLRALGLREPRSKPFAADEWTELRDAIGKLSVAQLAFEAIKRDIEHSDLFRRQ